MAVCSKTLGRQALCQWLLYRLQLSDPQDRDLHLGHPAASLAATEAIIVIFFANPGLSDMLKFSPYSYLTSDKRIFVLI